MKVKLVIVSLFFSLLSFAQNGTISGVVTDKDLKNEPLPFANVTIKGTTLGVTTAMDGKFVLEVPAGDHIVVFSFLGYVSKEVPFRIAAGEKKVINQGIGSGNVTLEDVVIKTTAQSREKETALLLDQKKAVEIKQSIGAQEMARKGVSDVEEGLTKITGITKVDSRGIFVRGLEDRYNNLLINDLAAPTNNPFKKIIPLDIFSTDVVGVIEVFKTFNPNIYGDFAGGTFNILSSKPTKSITKLSIGTGFTTDNSMEDFLISKEADNTAGFFGFNGNDRKFPTVLGSSPSNYTLTSQESKRSFKSGFNVVESKSPLNSSVGILHSEKFSFNNNANFVYLFSLNFDNDYAIRSGVDRTIDIQNTGFRYFNDFNYKDYIYKTSITSAVGLHYSSKKVKISSNTLYIKTSENVIKDQVGLQSGGLQDQLIRTNQLTKSDYLNTQLTAEFALNESGTQNIKVGASVAKTKYDQPDRKFFSGTIANDGRISTSYGGNNFLRQYLTIDGNSFFSGLAEYTLKFGKKDKQNKFVLGYNGNASQMESSYRFIASQPRFGGFTADVNSIDAQINDDLFNDNFAFRESSNASYKVKLNESANAGYINTLFKFGEKWEINGGVRVENSSKEIKYRGLGSFTDPFKIRKFTNTYVLPSLNVKYAVSEKSNIRFAVSKTYTRPVIMEAFPISYVNADGTSVQGNPLLLNSDNYLADLKFEIFPTNKEMFAIGVFGKHIQNPIERAFILNATTSTIASYLNSDSANLYGLEGECIVGLERIHKSLSDFSLGINASLMSTKVKVSPTYKTQDEDGNVTETNSIETHKDRSLQGASNWIVNSDLKYQFDFNKHWSNTISLVYAVFSKRIYAVGTNGQDHTYELPYQQLDFVWSNKLSSHFDVKFSADNLLNPSRNLEFGNEGTRPIVEESLISKSYKRGVGFSLKLGYTF
jgi:outer membrane receptor protein involved in Fe transport